MWWPLDACRISACSFKVGHHIHLIYVRYPLWFAIVCQIADVLRHGGAKVLFVGTLKVLSDMRRFGLASADEILLRENARDFVVATGAVTVHIQYNHKGVAEYVQCVRPATGQDQVTVSFYPDGYTNRIYKRPVVEALFAGGDENSGTLYQMDMAPKKPGLIPGVSGIETIDSGHIDGYINAAPVRQQATEALESLAIAHPDVVLLMLRSWGNPDNRLLKFDGGAAVYADVVAKTVAAIRHDIGRDVTVIVRPDNRDYIYSNRVMEALRPQVDFQLAAPGWHDRLPFDAFLYHFDQILPDARLHVVGFDSTASLPMIVLGKGYAHYFGAPEAAFPEALRDSAGVKQIQHKLKTLRQFLYGLPKGQCEIQEFCPMMFRVRTHA